MSPVAAVEAHAPGEKRVGIALAAYRPNVGYFRRQLESIQNQTCSRWFCVITSDSPLGEFYDHPDLAPFRSDERFIWLQNGECLGCRDNFGRAVRECLTRGAAFIACSDQDDVWYPEKLERGLSEIRKRPPLSLVHSDMRPFVEREGREERLPRTLWDLESRGVDRSDPVHFLIRDVASGAAMLFDAELVRRHPRIPPEFEFHDAWFAFLASAYGGVYPIREPLYDYRLHEKNVLGMNPFRGVFHAGGAAWGGILGKCRKKFELSRAMTLGALRERVPLPPKARRLFVSPWDFGLGLALLGVVYFVGLRGRDLPLARAAWARAVGKAFFGRSSLGSGSGAPNGEDHSQSASHP